MMLNPLSDTRTTRAAVAHAIAILRRRVAERLTQGSWRRASNSGRGVPLLAVGSRKEDTYYDIGGRAVDRE
jgi:hypothetical protein